LISGSFTVEFFINYHMIITQFLNRIELIKQTYLNLVFDQFGW